MVPATPFPHVVVGVDGSAASERALAWALRWATGSGHQVVAALVLPPGRGWVAGFDDVAVPPELSTEQGAALLAGIAVRASRLAGVDGGVRCRVLEGDVATQLVAEAREASLLVLGRSTRRRAARFLGAAPAVLTRAGCPVVVVPLDAPLPATPAVIDPARRPAALLATA